MWIDGVLTLTAVSRRLSYSRSVVAMSASLGILKRVIRLMYLAAILLECIDVINDELKETIRQIFDKIMPAKSGIFRQ